MLVCTNLSGTFTNVVAPQGISVSCASTGVVPVVTGKVPTTILGPVLRGLNAVLTFGTVSNRSYVVESAGDLAVPDWEVVTNLTGTGTTVEAVLPRSDAQRFFRVVQP